MARIEPETFLTELATFLATAAALQYAGVPRQLWTGAADESHVPQDGQGRPGVYSELRAYDGSVSTIGLPTAAVQCRTVGYHDGSTKARAHALMNCLLDAEQKKPLRNKTLSTLRILGVLNLRGPSLTGRDEKGRIEIVFNFDAQYLPA